MGGVSHRKPAGKAVGHRQHASSLVVVAQGDPAPECPAGMLAVTRKRWDEYWASPVSAAVDRHSDIARLERWIRQVDEYERVQRVFRKSRLVRGSTGQPVLNPLAAYINTLEQSIARTETEFGMTPMARLRLGIAVGEAHRSLAELNAEVNADDDDEWDDPRIVAVQAVAVADERPDTA